MPCLPTAFAYEVIFAVPARDLFAGVFQKVERDTSRRARRLTRKMSAANPDRLAERKRVALRHLLPASSPA